MEGKKGKKTGAIRDKRFDATLVTQV